MAAPIDDDRLIHSEVLCYVQCHLKRSAKANIIEGACRAFSEDIILSAKDVLDRHYGEKLASKLRCRRNGTNKMKGEQTMDDIVSAMLELDQNGVCTNFGAKNILILPKCDPKDVDSYAVLERLMVMEEKLRRVENGLNENVAAVILQKESLQRVSDTVSTHETLLCDRLAPADPTYADAVGSQPARFGGVKSKSNSGRGGPPNAAPPGGVTHQSRNAARSGAGVASSLGEADVAGDTNTVRDTDGTSGANSVSDVDGTSDANSVSDADGTGNAIVNGISDADGMRNGNNVRDVDGMRNGNSVRDVDSTGNANSVSEVNGVRSLNTRTGRSTANSANTQEVWTVIGRDGKPMKTVRPNRTVRKRRIQGSARSENIRGAPPPKRDFFISRFHRDTDDEGLKRYISEKGVTNFNMTLMSNANAMYKSYKLTVSIEDKDKVLCSEMWPHGVCIQRWRVRGGSIAHDEHRSNSTN